MSKLAEARQLLVERGLTKKGSLEDENGCLCALGALNMAYTGASGEFIEPEDGLGAYSPHDPDHHQDILALSVVASTRLNLSAGRDDDEPAYLVYKYNDATDTTLGDVLSLFDEAMAS